MDTLMTAMTIFVLMGSALIGGVFFAFSNFIMGALAKVPSPGGLQAMQSINVVVINPGFMLFFMGTALVAVIMAMMAIVNWTPASPWLVAGAATYVVGTFILTLVGNVPLNNRLAALDPEAAGSDEEWQFYLQRWTLFNTLRTIAALLAAFLLLLALMG